jgi:dTMP kinase
VGGRGLDEAKVRAANSVATGGLAPDITLVLDIEPGVGAMRQAAAGKVMDRMELADQEFHKRVNDWYRRATGPEVIHIDASGPPDTVADAAWRALASVRADIFV